MKILSLAFLVSLSTLHAAVQLPAIFSDHMVLKKAADVPIWGKADPGETVKITLNGRSAEATAGPDGRWLAKIDLTNSESGPFEMTVEGKNSLKISDVVVGEVWVASGQSNMEWTLKNTNGAEKEIAASANPMLRQFKVEHAASPQPLDDCKGAWTVASPQTSGNFSAVAYYFGKALQNELQVPVGLIHTSWGGTPSEAWTTPDSIASVPSLKARAERHSTRVRDFPEQKSQWIAAFDAWLAQTNRQDRPTADVAAFAGINVPTADWTPVTFPLPKDGKTLPAAGAIWLRTICDVPQKRAGAALRLEFPGTNSFEGIYWNGELIKQITPKNSVEIGSPRRISIPGDKVKAGPNTLAIRFFQPVQFVAPATAPRVGDLPVSEHWLAREEFALPALDAAQVAAAPKAPDTPLPPRYVASFLFNAMVHPVIPFAIDGAIWYQGESNAGRAFQYRTAFPLMITGWRKAWGQGDFPFYFCQLANYQQKESAPEESSWAELREAQNMTLALPNTGQAVLIDLGESADIHPRNKKDVGERLAKIALAKDYGKKIAFSGPVYESMKIDGSKAILTFSHADGGLVAKPVPETYDVRTGSGETAPTVRNSPDSELEGFAICGEDKVWHWAEAKIDGNSVIVTSKAVAKPVAVRYAWANNPTVNLYNAAGLPASPFRTDDFPAKTADAKY